MNVKSNDWILAALELSRSNRFTGFLISGDKLQYETLKVL